jgi:hypothetical protein
MATDPTAAKRRNLDIISRKWKEMKRRWERQSKCPKRERMRYDKGTG